MNKILYEIKITNNGYLENFNASILYMLKKLPDFTILKEKDGYLLVKVRSEKATKLIKWLSKCDCLKVCEIQPGSIKEEG